MKLKAVKIEGKCPICKKIKELIPVIIYVEIRYSDCKSNLNIPLKKLCIPCAHRIIEGLKNFINNEHFLK